MFITIFLKWWFELMKNIHHGSFTYFFKHQALLETTLASTNQGGGCIAARKPLF